MVESGGKGAKILLELGFFGISKKKKKTNLYNLELLVYRLANLWTKN